MYLIAEEERLRILFCFFVCLTEVEGLFCTELLEWCHPKVMPTNKLQEVCLENNKLIIEVQVKVLEVVHEGGVTTEKEMFNIEGFDVLYTQVC